jgi:hypothetical protein
MGMDTLAKRQTRMKNATTNKGAGLGVGSVLTEKHLSFAGGLHVTAADGPRRVHIDGNSYLSETDVRDLMLALNRWLHPTTVAVIRFRVTNSWVGVVNGERSGYTYPQDRGAGVVGSSWRDFWQTDVKRVIDFVKYLQRHTETPTEHCLVPEIEGGERVENIKVHVCRRVGGHWSRQAQEFTAEAFLSTYGDKL